MHRSTSPLRESRSPSARAFTGRPWGVWALAALLPRRRALFGSALAGLQFGIYGFWMNSYFRGAVAAAGALVFGAIARQRNTSNAFISALDPIVLFGESASGRPIVAVRIDRDGATRRRRFAWRPTLALLLVLGAGIAATATLVTRTSREVRGKLPHG
jgi:hypothetical protein